MPQAAVRAGLLQPLDVHRDLPPEVALDLVTAVDDLAQPAHLLVRQVAHTGVRVDVRLGKDLLTGRQPDTVDVRERDLHALLARDVDDGDACHTAP